MQEKFEVKYNIGLEMVTIRYYTPESVTEITYGRQIYVDQKSRKTARMLLK